jgi:hypothetical protein
MPESDADKHDNIELLTLELLYGPGLFVIPGKQPLPDENRQPVAKSEGQSTNKNEPLARETEPDPNTLQPETKLLEAGAEPLPQEQAEPIKAGLILFAEQMDTLTPEALTMLEKISAYVATQLLPDADIIIQGKGDELEKRPFAVGFGPEAGPLKYFKPVMAGGRLVLLLPAAETLAKDIPLKLKAIDALKVWAGKCIQQHG